MNSEGEVLIAAAVQKLTAQLSAAIETACEAALQTGTAGVRVSKMTNRVSKMTNNITGFPTWVVEVTNEVPYGTIEEIQ